MNSCRANGCGNLRVLRPCDINDVEDAGVEASGASGVSHTASPVEVEAEEEEEFGSRSTVRMLDPRTPSPAEVAEHELTHLPFRNWCRHCVKGRGKEAPHRKQTTETSVPELHLDLMFLGEEADPGNTLTILVAKERQTKMSLASVMPNKSTGHFLCSRVLAFLKEIGCDTGDLTVKSDQEPAMQSVIQDLEASCGQRWWEVCRRVQPRQREPKQRDRGKTNSSCRFTGAGPEKCSGNSMGHLGANAAPDLAVVG